MQIAAFNFRRGLFVKRYFFIGIAFGVLFSPPSADLAISADSVQRCGIKAEPNDANNAVSNYLKKLNNRTRSLESYQCRIEYLFEQPVFETKTLQTGVLYYQKDSGKSALRINFATRKEEEEKEQKYQDEYIFDGIWLTHIDYQVREVKRYQSAEGGKENESVDAFDLVAKNFPILGFSKVEELEKKYDIKLLEKENTGKSAFGGFVGFSLSPKPDSEYKDYKTINIWADSSIDLPAKIIATNADGDIYQVRFLEPKINQKIDKKVFEYKVPKGFTVEINKLNEESK
jgi:outer membrane lipoprotein-sorting protein